MHWSFRQKSNRLKDLQKSRYVLLLLLLSSLPCPACVFLSAVNWQDVTAVVSAVSDRWCLAFPPAPNVHAVSLSHLHCTYIRGGRGGGAYSQWTNRCVVGGGGGGGVIHAGSARVSSFTHTHTHPPPSSFPFTATLFSIPSPVQGGNVISFFWGGKFLLKSVCWSSFGVFTRTKLPCKWKISFAFGVRAFSNPVVQFAIFPLNFALPSGNGVIIKWIIPATYNGRLEKFTTPCLWRFTEQVNKGYCASLASECTLKTNVIFCFCLEYYLGTTSMSYTVFSRSFLIATRTSTHK